jgi:hypothetical protein
VLIPVIVPVILPVIVPEPSQGGAAWRTGRSPSECWRSKHQAVRERRSAQLAQHATRQRGRGGGGHLQGGPRRFSLQFSLQLRSRLSGVLPGVLSGILGQSMDSFLRNESTKASLSRLQDQRYGSRHRSYSFSQPRPEQNPRRGQERTSLAFLELGAQSHRILFHRS